MDYVVFVYLSPIVTGCVVYLLWLCIKRWEYSPVRYLSFFIISCLGFLVSNIFELITATERFTLFWARNEHIFVSGIPVTWLLFVFDFTGKNEWKAPKRFWPFFIPAALNISLVFTNDLHHLIWEKVQFIPIGRFLGMRVTHGPMYIPIMALHYSLMLLGIVLLLKEFMRSPDIYRWQLLSLIIGIFIALAFNVIYIFQLIPWLKKDYTPMGFALGSIVFSFGIFKHRLLELIPFPRTKLFDSLSEGIMVIDRKNRIIDINTAASEILGLSKDAIGTSPYSHPLLVPLLEKNMDGEEIVQNDITVKGEEDAEERHYELRLKRMLSAKGKILGSVIVIHDITERLRLFEEIKTLRGIIPICAQCKKIRTDAGYWQQVEAYIAEHSYAEFSHGLCPDCLKAIMEKKQ